MSHGTSGTASLSAERQEHRYLLAPERAQAFARALTARLPHDRFRGANANTLPRPQHFVTTIYFDTPSRHAFHALRAANEVGPSGAARGPLSKLRAREYYDLHPSLTELATDPRDVVRRSPGIWLELKFRDGTRTGKRRLTLPKRYVPELLAMSGGSGSGRPAAPAPVATVFENDAQTPAPFPLWEADVLRDIFAFCAQYPEPLRADCLVHYRRLPWQDADGQLRVTLDLGVELFSPPEDVWRREQTLMRETLGRPKHRFERAIIELKCRAVPPGWLIDLLGRVGAEPSRVSKFEEASQAVHGVAD
jgi:hypothetical protein